jgi:hypothetical protein
MTSVLSEEKKIRKISPRISEENNHFEDEISYFEKI